MRGSVNVPGAFGRERIEAEMALEARIASAEKTLNGTEKIPGSSPPTPQVTAQVGQIYINVTTGEQWKCVSADASGTVWEKLAGSTVGLTAADVGAVPDTRKVNGKPLNADISLTPSDVGAVATTEKGKPGGVATLDATGKVPAAQLPASMPASDVAAWAKQPTKPAYTAGEVGAKASTWSAFYAGTSAPSDTTQFWIDTTANTGGLKYWNGSAWVAVPVAYT